MKNAVLIILLTVVAVFSVQNASLVSVTALFWKMEAPLTLVIAASMLIGMLTGGVIVYRPKAKGQEPGKKPTGEKKP